MVSQKRIVFITVVICAVLGGGLGAYLFYKPTKNFAHSKADVVMAAKDLFAEFSKDQNAANAKYVTTDKTIQITGTVTDTKKNDDGTLTVILDGGMAEATVSATLTPAESAKAAFPAKGSSIKIKGQCSGYQELISKEVIMIRCGIVK